MGVFLPIVSGGGSVEPPAPEGYEQLVNYLMLYGNGDECEDVHGGFSLTYKPSSGSTTLTKETSNLKIYNTGATCKVSGENKLDLTEYVKCYGVGSFTNYSSAESGSLWFGFVTTPTTAYDSSKDFLTPSIKSNTKQSVSLDISSKNGTYYPALLVYYGTAIVNGFFIAKADDWQTWLSLGGVTGFTDLDTLVNDATAMATLMSNENACNYMVKQMTGEAMFAILNSEVAMNALVSNIAYDYAFNNEHWYKCMTMCLVSLAAMDSVAVSVPTMTSNTTPSGVAFVEPADATYAPYKMFDRDGQTYAGAYYKTGTNTPYPHYFGYEFENPIELYKMEINPISLTGTSGGYNPKNYILQYSNDGVTYHDAESGVITGTHRGSYVHILKKPVVGKFFRIKALDGYYTASDWSAIYELNFYGKAVAE